MYFKSNISTLKVIEEHIKILEFAFTKIYPTIDEEGKQLCEIELGHAYNMKMKLINFLSHDTHNQQIELCSKTYSSKINSKEIAGKGAG